MVFFSPVLCNYYVTLRCNSRCGFCSIWKDKKNFKIREQSLEEIEQNLRDLKKLGVRVIDFTGGEPLLYPNIIGALRLAKKYGFFTTVTTNCILYPKYAKDLKGLVDIMNFSLESCDEKEHDKIRGVPCHKKVIESIEEAKKAGQKIMLIHTVTNENIDNIPALIEFSKKNHVPLVLNPCFEYFGNAPMKKETAKKIGKYFLEPRVIVNPSALKLIESGGNDINCPVCKAVSSVIVISPDNKLVLPCFHKGFEKLNINGNLYNLYKSEKVRTMMKSEGKFNFCKGCTINCYMRASLFRRYPLEYLAYSIKYLIERARKQ